ncbi:hypothetical protein D3C84_1302600 [compost metagenome]
MCLLDELAKLSFICEKYGKQAQLKPSRTNLELSLFVLGNLDAFKRKGIGIAAVGEQR